MTSFDVKRKRKWWVSWIPAGILLVVIIGVGITMATLLGNGLGEPMPEATVGQVTELNWSSFSEEGLDYIERSRDVRIDMSKPPLDASALNLPEDGTVTIGPSNNDDTDNDYYLIINGGGEGYGGKKFTTTEMAITTAGGELTAVTAVSGAGLPFRVTLNNLTKQAEEFGWLPLDTDALFAQVEAASRAGADYEFTTGPGDRLGMTVSATANCGSSGTCAVTYRVTPTVR